MARVLLALVGAAGALILTPQAAAGGGWWSYIETDRSTVAAGQRVEVHDGVYFGSSATAEGASGRFYVYLLRDFDYSIVERAMGKADPRNWWSLRGAEAIQVGSVSVTSQDPGFARASAAFTVPELPHGTYHLMLCDLGCEEPLADVIPMKGFTIVADPATAKIADRLDGLERRLGNQAGEITGARRDAERALAEAMVRVRSEIDLLEDGLASLADEDEGPPWPAYAGWLVAGLLAGTLSLLAVRRRRRSRPRLDPVAAERYPSDEELEELLASGSGRDG